MKTRVAAAGYSRSAAGNPSLYVYLKPGDLARLRDSKITARFRKATTKQAVLVLNLAYDRPSSPDSAAMDIVPCFRNRSAKLGRCLTRRKIVAVKPYFPESV